MLVLKKINITKTKKQNRFEAYTSHDGVGRFCLFYFFYEGEEDKF